MSHYSHSSGFAVGIALVLLNFVAATSNPVAAAAPTDSPSTWKPEIKSQYEAIRSLPGASKEPVLAAIRKLAALGPDARPAINALAADGTLPEPHRAYSGIIGASYAQFDVATLRTLAESHRNPFVRREAIDSLADIGGPAIRAFLEGLAKKDSTLSAYIGKAVARAPATELIAERDRKLLSEILLEPPERKKTAAVVLVDRYKGKTTMDASLEKLAGLAVADSDAQIYAAIALTRIHGDDVPRLKALTARDKHRFIRLNAMQELAKKGPAGEAVLRELLAAPGEPLKPQLEKLLAKK